MGKIKDLTGQRFGITTAIELTNKRASDNSCIWKCRCDCGKIHESSSNNLRRGHTKSCGCLKIKAGHNNCKDLTGQRFDRLVAIRKTEMRRGSNVIWECKCDCGNITYTTTNDLLMGHTKSCGCKRKRDITGMRMGKLIAIRPTDKIKNGSIVWICKCDCGSFVEVAEYHFIRGSVASCGCNTKSSGHTIIETILSNSNINFKSEKRFKNCKDTLSLPFDIYVENKYIIEYDGEQHYKPIEAWGGEVYFDIVKKHDSMKNKYCFENNIPIIRIPYTVDLKSITLEDLVPETSKYLVKPN